MSEAVTQSGGSVLSEGSPQGSFEPEVEQQPERTFSQQDLNKIAANEKRAGTKSGREAAISELLERTGAESIDDVLSSYEEYKSVKDVTETEADRVRTRAERLEKRAKTAEEKYTNTLKEYALRDALRDEGINSARLPLALKVADLSSIDVGDDGVSGTDSVVEMLREASPEWFSSNESPQRTNAPQTSGTGVQRPAAKGSTTEEISANFLQNLLGGR